ncbi:hypothetical protein BXZ70DRAFT_214929 [Cristinia sonorae]|uniref:Uncharacterized protein n=1 Tax=Cristinia sonorae TaxID=1940300 RepID=A0A8K0XP03_9AGAR|nr:hypothetical protein BXZ70DRAFT_214929 [Cristinia sonorae]
MTLMPNTTPSAHSSQLSPNTPGPSSPWPIPRAPLPPHRLAKLANALGISTPVPHTHAYSLSPSSPASLPNTSSSLTFPDLRRSPTPSSSTYQSHTPSVSAAYSKYLLHVLPPEHLPHEFSDPDDLTLAPPSASGYHTQFRRGVMVPVYPTLQAQLGAIAREYALPSTLGMVLYLVTNPDPPSAVDEPGPRISEDIWKHIWMRVLRAEKEELTSPGPRPLGLGFSLAGQSSPALLQDITANGHSLKSITLPTRADTQQSMTPSPSTPSNSGYSSQSELEPPESASSVAASGDIGASAIRLPGLNSPSLIPILAKVEFDIDRRRAGWYEPWVRSRKVQHAKRAESRAGARSRSRMGSASEAGEGPETQSQAGTRAAPIDLELLRRINADGSSVPRFLVTRDGTADDGSAGEDEEEEEDAGYQQLEDASPVGEDEESERISGDPLADVFGTDHETWAEVHAETQAQRSSMRNSNPHVVDLALDAAALNSLPDDLEEDEDEIMSDDEGEVTQLLNAMNRPSLSLDIPTTMTPSNDPETAATLRKHVPPPLTLVPTDGLHPPSISPHLDSANSQSEHLAYLKTPSEAEHPSALDEPPIEIEVEVDDLFKTTRSPQDEKREGGIFDALNLGLDPSFDDFDENDPHDRRRSQYIMSAQLDEIEKTLASLSPRKLAAEIASESPAPTVSSFSSFSPERNVTPAPRPSSQRTSAHSQADEVPSWPAVPYSQLSSHRETDEDAPPSPPRFAFNGITTEPPKSFQPKRAAQANIVSSESLARKRAMEEENGLYPPLTPGVPYERFSSESPIIPLSPDPFGRFPSEPEHEEHRQSVSEEVSPQPAVQQLSRGSSLTVPSENSRPPSQAPSSRFSIDSMTSEDPVTTQRMQKSTSTLMSVKNIRKLWRKSGNKGSISGSAPPPPPTNSGRSSPNVLAPPAAPAPAPPPPAEKTGRKRSKSVSKQAAPEPIPPSPSPVPSVSHSLAVPQNQPVYKQFHFNQDSPYPIHPMGRSPPAPSPRELSPPVPPSALPSNPSPQPGQRPPSISQQPDRNSVRKSILKSWKSASGLHGSKSSISRPPSSSETPRSSTDLPLASQTETVKRRRPSVLDIAQSVMRNSAASSSTTLNGSSYSDIPPSPAIPEQFIHQMGPPRSSSRQSELTLNSTGGGRRDSDTSGGGGMKPSRPSVSSSTLTSSPPRVRSPLTAASPPRNGNLSAGVMRKSIDSYESRPSLDVSQFEMVSPKKDGYLESTLTYPYHGLDHH